MKIPSMNAEIGPAVQMKSSIHSQDEDFNATNTPGVTVGNHSDGKCGSLEEFSGRQSLSMVFISFKETTDDFLLVKPVFLGVFSMHTTIFLCDTEQAVKC